MNFKTLIAAGLATVALSGAALAGPVDITVSQTSAGGLGSRNSANINSTASGSSNVFVSQDGASRQNMNVNARSGGSNTFTGVQTNGGFNSMNTNLRAGRGGVDAVIVQDGRFANRANFNAVTPGAVKLDSFQNAGRSNSLTGNVRAPGGFSGGIAQNTFRPGGINHVGLNVLSPRR